MQINLKKWSVINLVKPDSNNSAKNKSLNNICFWLNWGQIAKNNLENIPEKKGFLKKISFKLKTFFSSSSLEVDLDWSCACFSKNNNLLKEVSFRNLKAYNWAILHSWDDLTWDSASAWDDWKDNEIIQINLSKLPEEVETIFLFLNSFKKQDFSKISYASVRIFEWSFSKVENILASFEITKKEKYLKKIACIMWKLSKTEEWIWKFEAIWDPTKDENIKEVIDNIQANYLK